MPILNGASPDVSCFYNKTTVSSETLASSTSWTQQLEIVDLFSDPKLTNQIGYKVQNNTAGTDVYQYQGTLYFGNQIGSVTFVNGDENASNNPNKGDIYLDRISGGKKDFILAEGIITTVYPLEGDVVAVYIYLSK